MMRRSRGLDARRCLASGWTGTYATVDRAGNGDEQCPVCSAHLHCEHVGRRAHIPDHPPLSAVTVAVTRG